MIGNSSNHLEPRGNFETESHVGRTMRSKEAEHPTLTPYSPDVNHPHILVFQLPRLLQKKSVFSRFKSFWSFYCSLMMIPNMVGILVGFNLKVNS